MHLHTSPINHQYSWGHLKFLGTTITSDLKWETHAFKCHQVSSPKDDALPAAREDEHFLESLHTVLQGHHRESSITVWYPTSSTLTNRLESIMQTTSQLTGQEHVPASVLQDVRGRKRASRTVCNPSHLAQCLPSSCRFCSIYTRTTRHVNSFYPPR